MYAFAIIAILIAVYAFSGAFLNPIITVGMMATRRVSVIRGIMYIIAEIIGAWLGWLIFNGFHLAGGETAYDIPTMSAIAEGGFWIVTMVELLGATIIGFFFARAIDYKRSVFTFAAVVAGGLALAVLIGYVVSAAFLGLSNNFVFNPSVALMMQIFPQAGESFGEILGGICQALSVYALVPMIGGIIGFYLSDFTKKLSED
jgi:glycerol uptake facilitator-like aquaporin